MDSILKIVKEQVQGNVHVTVLHLRGWLDAQSEEMLLAAARDSYEEGSRFILIDLAEVDTLTSAGMRAMQKVYKLYTPPRGTLQGLTCEIMQCASAGLSHTWHHRLSPKYPEL